MSPITFTTSAGISIAFFVVLLLLTKEKRSLTDKLLAFWVSALGLNQIYFLASGPDGIQMHFLVAITGMGMVLVHTPLLYLFVKYSFREKISLSEWVHAIPFFLFLAVFSMIYLLNPEDARIVDGFIMLNEPLISALQYYGLFFALTAGTYTFASLNLIRKKKKTIEQFYSNQSRQLFRWLELWIIAALLFFAFTWLVVELTVTTGTIAPALTFGIISSFMTIYILFVGFLGVRFTRFFHQPLPQLLETETPDHNEIVNLDDLRKIAELIQEATSNKKLYLQPDLSLADLARETDTSLQRISQALNRVIGKNFYSFINEYRADHYIRLLNHPDYEHFSLLGLAYECGFGAKSTFYDFFKSYTGTTPSMFKKGLKK